MNRMLFGLIVASAIAAETSADTIVPANINGGTWTLSGSPYRLRGKATNAAGYTLRIEPGVVVQGGAGFSLQNNGTLLAIGTAAQPILFTAEGTSWGGLRFCHAGTGSQMTHCIVEKVSGANPEGAVHLTNCSALFANCTIRDNSETAFALFKASPLILNCRILNNAGADTGGIYVDDDSRPQVRNSLLANNEGGTTGAIIMTVGGNFMELLNCTIANNKVTGSLHHHAARFSTPSIVRNSIFSDNVDKGGKTGSIELSTSSFVPLLQNCLVEEGYVNGTWIQSGQATFMNPTTLPGVTSLQTGTANGQPADYSLQAGSPGVDAGDGTFPAMLSTDLAGNPRVHNALVDMGCYEYVPKCTNGTPVVIRGAVRIEVNSERGRKYRFWYRDNVAAADWQILGDVVIGTGGRIGVFDTASNPHRFYRVTDSAE
jgi:hypothetical protein